MKVIQFRPVKIKRVKPNRPGVPGKLLRFTARVRYPFFEDRVYDGATPPEGFGTYDPPAPYGKEPDQKNEDLKQPSK